ncbi:MAG TPA: AAA domain-containing protein [Streptosporangiaceae bacterium]|nr:AAA domain-containing protein [Streptosporangiaceae bacterium]
MSWQDEVCGALDEWIRLVRNSNSGSRGGNRWIRVGAALRTADAGVYVVDIRGIDLSAVETDSLRLAEHDGEPSADGLRVRRISIEGELLRLWTAEFAEFAEPCLWRFRQPPDFLITTLRDEIARMTQTGLAALLVRGEAGGVLGPGSSSTWLLPAQQDAYRACLGTGLWLVWGPPGTGKTRVLRAAVGDLVARGKRVLLVSATNIAVDNALAGVIQDRQHDPGQLVRVGPPQLREIAGNPDVCLPLIVATRLAEIARKRQELATKLLEMNQRRDQLQDLESRLAEFDQARYEAAVALLADPHRTVARSESAIARCELIVGRSDEELSESRAALAEFTRAAAETSADRPIWAEIAAREAELDEIEDAALQAQARALVAENTVRAADGEIAALCGPGGRVRWRDRGALRQAQGRLETARAAYLQLDAEAMRARDIAASWRRRTKAAIAELAATTKLSRDEISRRDEAVAQAKARLAELEAAQSARRDKLAGLRARLVEATSATEVIAAAQQHDWPATYRKVVDLRREVTSDNVRRGEIEEQHGKLEQQYESLARNAQDEVIKDARVVATTLARFRTNRAVLRGPYDVVLIDEAGAVTLPEALLAVAKASSCAVLFGDFMQNGPVLESGLERSQRPDVRRWLVTDVFRNCGIATPAQAHKHRGCVVLDTQHRFGPVMMRLANLIAYDGVLKSGAGTRSHAADDPEIVLVDTDGLGDLAEVRRVKRRSGWWTAGPLLARALAELHAENGEGTGVITPYRVQADITLEALRDIEKGGLPLAEVGTAHRSQGREFPIVVFDTVEGELGDGLWMSFASRGPASNSWKQEGMRLFNVAATRAQRRLYVVASRRRILAADPDTTFGHFAAMLRDRSITTVAATKLLAATADLSAPAGLGQEGMRVAEILARHAEVSDIHDDLAFYEHLARVITEARISIWIWSAWVASRVRSLLPLLKDAVDRGVRVTVFVRDPSDSLQRKDHYVAALADLRLVVTQVVEVNVLHQKIVIVDERTTLLGSLNPLSQHRSREVMVTMQGQHFARRLLKELHAEKFSRPPKCVACGGQRVDLRREPAGTWFWRCYDRSCPRYGTGSHRGWTQSAHP